MSTYKVNNTVGPRLNVQVLTPAQFRIQSQKLGVECGFAIALYAENAPPLTDYKIPTYIENIASYDDGTQPSSSMSNEGGNGGRGITRSVESDEPSQSKEPEILDDSVADRATKSPKYDVTNAIKSRHERNQQTVSKVQSKHPSRDIGQIDAKDRASVARLPDTQDTASTSRTNETMIEEMKYSMAGNVGTPINTRGRA